MTPFDPTLPTVIGNWKQNTDRRRAVGLADAVAARPHPGVQVGIAPPFIWLDVVRQRLSDIAATTLLGAQNVSQFPNGAFTGEVSAAMVAEICDFTVVGHSERRKHLGESDEVVRRKVSAAREAGLSVVVCVGETAEERDVGVASDVVDRQLRGALDGVTLSADAVVVAYEPVWAIGTGRSATPDDVVSMTASIRETLRDLDPENEPTVVYGGSVTPANAAGLFAIPGVGGFLVGGASLDADQFAAIVSAVAGD